MNKSYQDRSQSLSTPPPSLSYPTSVPLSASPMAPFLPNLSTQSNPMTMSPPPIGGASSRRCSISSTDERVVDNAIASERDRIKELEKKENEADLGVEDLKLMLKRERSRSVKLIGELASMKSMFLASQAEAEVCEEGRINGLMRRLDCVQKEKGRIIVELEREEEMVSFFAVTVIDACLMLSMYYHCLIQSI